MVFINFRLIFYIKTVILILLTMKGEFALEINIKVNTQNLKLDEKKVLRSQLQKLVDELTSEIKHQHLIEHKHNK